MNPTASSGLRALLGLLPAVLLSAVLAFPFAAPVKGQIEAQDEAQDEGQDDGENVAVQDSPFGDETDVVAIDRMVGLEGTAGWLRGGKLPRKLEISELQAWASREDGDDAQESRMQLTPVALEKVVRGLPERAEPWTVVVLLDSQLASTRTIRWAVGLLADRAEELTGLGRVTVWLTSGDEVVPAGTDLKTLLLPTDETTAVKELLSRLALLTKGEDSVLQRRWDWVEGGEDEAMAARAAADETLTLRTALDARLLRLTEQGRGSASRRLLLWVTDGFDLAPWRFYGVESTETGEHGEDDDGGALYSHFEDAVRALSSDGWIAVALRPPDQDPYRGKSAGVRIGKWRFIGFPPFIAGTYESERDPEQAEAYLELGDARLAGGDVVGAADAYGRAYHHFYGDPKTGDRQAVALLRMSDCLEILGDRMGARKARALASEVDPEAAARHLPLKGDGEALPGSRPGIARLLDPREPLRLLADETSGALVANAEELETRLLELERRLRLTVQLPAGLTRGLYRVEILWRGEPTRAPRWIRAGEAPAVDAAETRRGDRRVP